MDYLFTPWRYAYITAANAPSDCLFCGLIQPKNAQPKNDQTKNDQTKNDEKALIVHRAKYCFVMLNAFPYTSGHAMIVPYDHVDELSKLSQPAAQEMMTLTQRLEGILRDLYQSDGINLGMNIGKAAGAGVASHIHMHILPRWFGDVNFMSSIGETRVLPEDLQTTYKKLRSKF
jgi:ATP adenylyltransferase